MKSGSLRGTVGTSLSSEYRGSLRPPRLGRRSGGLLPPLSWGSLGSGCNGGIPTLPGGGRGWLSPGHPQGAGRKPLSRWGAPSPPLRATRPFGPGPRPGPGSGCGSGSRSAWCSGPGPGPGARPGCAPSRHRGSALRPARTCLPASRLHPRGRAPPPAPLSVPLGALPCARALTQTRALPPAGLSRRAPRGAETPRAEGAARGAPTPLSCLAGS